MWVFITREQKSSKGLFSDLIGVKSMLELFKKDLRGSRWVFANSLVLIYKLMAPIYHYWKQVTQNNRPLYAVVTIGCAYTTYTVTNPSHLKVGLNHLDQVCWRKITKIYKASIFGEEISKVYNYAA